MGESGDLLVYAPENFAGEALCRLLRRRHLSPKYFHTVDALLEQIRFGLASIVILDLSRVPTINKDLEELLVGIEETPVIMVTPYNLNDQELTRFHQRGYHLMEKPVCINELLQLIRKLG